MLRTSACIALQPFCEALARAGIASLARAHRGGRLAIILLEVVIEPLVGAIGIVIERQCHIHRSRELVRIASSSPGDSLHLAPLPAPLRGVRSNGQPAVEVAAGAFEACGQGSADPDGWPAWPVRAWAQDPLLDFPTPLPIDWFAGP